MTAPHENVLNFYRSTSASQSTTRMPTEETASDLGGPEDADCYSKFLEGSKPSSTAEIARNGKQKLTWSFQKADTNGGLEMEAL